MSRDSSRESLIREIHNRVGIDYLVQDPKLTLKDFHVQKLLYVNDSFEGTLFFVSQLQTKPNQPSTREIPDGWYQVIGGEKSIPLDALFVYNKNKNGLYWEFLELTDLERDQIIQTVNDRHQLEQRETEEQELILKSQKLQKQQAKRNWDYVRYQDQIFVESESQETAFNPYQVKDLTLYIKVVDLMKQSEVLKSSPGFLERIQECEEDFQVFRETGTMPDRTPPLISNMMSAMGIKEISS